MILNNFILPLTPYVPPVIPYVPCGPFDGPQWLLVVYYIGVIILCISTLYMIGLGLNDILNGIKEKRDRRKREKLWEIEKERIKKIREKNND